MEYLEYGNLRQQGDLTISETATMLEQQFKTLTYLHGSDITHRDITPDNILIKARYPHLFTKLTDFGFSTDQTELISFCGTPEYTAPEVQEEEKIRRISI